MKTFPPSSRHHFLREFPSREKADAFWSTEHRFLARIQRTGTYTARQKLNQAPEWLSIRQVAGVLGCSKSTVRKQIHLGLLKVRQRRKQACSRVRLTSESVRAFLHFCERMREFLRYAPQLIPGERKVLSRVRQRAVATGYRSLPGVMTVSDAAVRLGCSPSSILRLIRSGELDAIRISPCRWRVLKEGFRNFSQRKKCELGQKKLLTRF